MDRRVEWRRRKLRRRLLVAAGILVLAVLALIVAASQLLVAPPRPRVSQSARPFLGVVYRTEADGLRIVRAVPPASQAGLRSGDLVVGAAGSPVADPTEFSRRILETPAGERFRVEARRVETDGTETAILVDVPLDFRPVSPADQGLAFEEVLLTNRRGESLRGWYVPPRAPTLSRGAPGVVYGHGNGTDRRQWLPIAWEIHEAGFGQLFLDFAGRGDSEGSTISLGAHEAADLLAGVTFLRDRPEIDAARVALAGRSMGAVAAVLSAAEDPGIAALVLDSPFTDLESELDHVLSSYFLPSSVLRPPLLAVAAIRGRFEPTEVRPIDRVVEIRAPILLFHGEEDRLVPFAHAEAFRQAAGDDLVLVPLPGLGHNSPRPSDYGVRIARFLENAVQ